MQSKETPEAVEKSTINYHQSTENDSPRNQKPSPQNNLKQNVSPDAAPTEISARVEISSGPNAELAPTHQTGNGVICVDSVTPHSVEIKLQQSNGNMKNTKAAAPDKKSANKKRPASPSETDTCQKAARTEAAPRPESLTRTTPAAPRASQESDSLLYGIPTTPMPPLDIESFIRALPLLQPPGPPRARIFLATRPWVAPPMPDQHPLFRRLLRQHASGDPNTPQSRASTRNKYRRLLEYLGPLTADIVMYMVQCYTDGFYFRRPMRDVIRPRPVRPSAAVGRPDAADENSHNLRRDVFREIFMRMRPNEIQEAEVPEAPAPEDPRQRPQ